MELLNFSEFGKTVSAAQLLAAVSKLNSHVCLNGLTPLQMFTHTRCTKVLEEKAKAYPLLINKKEKEKVTTPPSHSSTTSCAMIASTSDAQLTSSDIHLVVPSDDCISNGRFRWSEVT